MIGVLSAEDVAIVRAEQRGADFGVLAEVGTGTASRAELEQALTVVLAHWPSLTARISRDGETLLAHADPPATVRDLEHEGDLRGCTVLASRGERLLRYRFDENRRVLQLLGHHVVLDADSLDALLADLDAVLAGRELAGSPEWPWERTEDRRTLTCVVDQSSDITRMPDGRPHRAAERALHGPTEAQPETSDGGVAPLAASSRPKPSAHAMRPLEPGLVDRTARAAKASGVTPFGIYWAAASRLADQNGEAALATVVSARLLSRTPRRSGNATTSLTVGLRPYRPGREGVREAFGDFTATWRGRRHQADVATSPLLVSLSVAPTGRGLEVLGPVELGPYVVKFERHVQVQVVGDAVVLEAHATPSGQYLLDAFVVALTDVVDECLLSSTPRQTLHRVTDRAVAQSLPAPVVPTGGALGRLLTATPEALVRDVGVTSFDVLSVIDDLAEGYGIRVGVETFYTWETAGDVQRFVTARSGTGSARVGSAVDSDHAESTRSIDSIVVPHLNDVFIDAYRRGDDDPYAVELAFVIDPALAGSASRLAEHTRRCLARHEVWRASTRFGPEGVVLDLTGPVTPVREVVAATWNEVRDPHRLSVRNPSRLADAAVAEVGDELGFYLNVHHLLLDHTGLEVFLADLLTELRAPSNGAPVTWSSLTAPLASAREQAAEVWAENPIPADALPIGPAGSVSGDHLQHRMPWGRREHDTLDLETSLRAVTTALAEFTGERRGIVGSVHHGRTVPGSDRLVGALARVLPAAYDLDDEAVLAASVRRLLTGQAALAADTRGPHGARANGSALPMPVVFQAIRSGGSADAGEHGGIVRRVEFEARTKFPVLLTLVAATEGDVLEVTLSTDHYDALDLARLVHLLVRVAPGARTLERVAGATR